MGIEPTKSRANDPSTALKAVGTTGKNPPQSVTPQAFTTKPHTDEKGDCTTHCTKLAPKTDPDGLSDDPTLAAVVTAWPSLPEALRAGIAAMVRTASGLI